MNRQRAANCCTINMEDIELTRNDRKSIMIEHDLKPKRPEAGTNGTTGTTGMTELSPATVYK
jgi:hypothetical protein